MDLALKQNSFEIQFVKIHNFKSYKKPSFFDTFETTGWITGKNGTGKTNLIEAFIFVCGETLKNVNCSSFEYLFPDFSIQKNFIVSRVDLVIKYNCIFIKISRTIDADGINEFYLNDKSVSFFHFKILFDWIGLKHVGELVFLNNLENNFIFSNKDCLTKLFYDLVNFKKKNKVWEKIKILKNKLQANDYFYLEKIKFIINQKKFFSEKEKIVNKSKFLKINIKKEKKKILFYKKRIFLHEYLKLLKINTQKLLQSEYLFFYSFSIITYKIKCKYLSKKNSKLRKNSIINTYQFLLLNFFNISEKIKKFKIVFSLILKKYIMRYFLNVFQNIYFRKNKSYKKFYVILYTKSSPFFLNMKKKFLEILLVYNMNFNRLLVNIKTQYACSTKCDLFSFVYLYVFYKFKNISMFIKLDYEKIIFNLVFCNIYFIFMIKFFIKNPNVTKVKTIKNLYQIIPNFLSRTIRGLCVDLFKILDCSYKLTLKKFIKKKSNSIFINNPDMITSLIKYIKKIQTYQVQILVKKNLDDIHDFTKKNIYIFLKYLEFEESDLVCFFCTSKQNYLDGQKKLYKKKKNLKIHEYYILKNSIYPIISFFSNKLKKKSSFNKKRFFFLKQEIKQMISNKITFISKQKKNHLTNNHLTRLFTLGVFKLFEKHFNRIFFFTILKHFLSDCAIFFLIYTLFENFFFNLKKVLFELKKKKMSLRKNIFYLNSICIFIYKTKKKITNKQNFGFKFCKKNISVVNLFSLNYLNIINKEIYTRFFFAKFIISIVKKNKYSKSSKRFKNISNSFLNKLYKIIDLKKKILNYIYKENIKLINIKIFFKILNFKLLKHTRITYLVKNFMFRIRANYKQYLDVLIKKSRIYYKNQLLVQKFFNFNAVLDKKIFQKDLFFLKKQIKYNHSRFIYIRSKLLENKYRYLLLSKKINKSQEKLLKKLEVIFQIVSTKVNYIYKQITKTRYNPSGGIAFLKFSNEKNNKIKNISYTAIPFTRKICSLETLSGGEKIVASFSLIMALHKAYSPPIIFCDELDENLDNIHFKKILKYLITNSNKKKIKTYMISLKLKFAKSFERMSFILKNQKGSSFYKIFL